MKHILKKRDKRQGEEYFYEVQEGGELCLQGQFLGKRFISLSELNNLEIEGECIVTPIPLYCFTEPVEPETPIFDKWIWYREVVTPAIVAHIESIITNPQTYDYLDYYEPFGYLNDMIHNEEATKIVEWIKNIWIVVRPLIEQTETEIDIDVIIQQLPELVI